MSVRRLIDVIFPGQFEEFEEGELVCPTCRVYCREGRFDGHNHYTVCAYCGRSELEIVGTRRRTGEEAER